LNSGIREGYCCAFEYQARVSEISKGGKAMNNSLTRNRLSGRATGALFFTGFGAVWQLLSLYVRERLGAVNVSWVAAGTIVLLSAAMLVFRQARRFPQVPGDPAFRRVFIWTNMAQWAAISVVMFSFARLRIDAYLFCAVSAIVGLHLLPLARVLRYPMHYATGGLLIVWAALSAWLAPIDRMQGATTLGTGCILWASAAVTLAAALVASMRRPAGSGRTEHAA
jgi:hypothetical protein